MSTLIDEALAKSTPTVNLNQFRDGCAHLRLAKPLVASFSDELASRAAHCRTYGMPDDNTAVIDKLAPLREQLDDCYRELAAICKDMTDP